MSHKPKPDTDKKRRLRIANKRVQLAKIILSHKTTEEALDRAREAMGNPRKEPEKKE